MEEKIITCINCPVGCRMTVTLDNGRFVSVKDNFCKRGDTYARQESVMPLRMVTAVAPVSERETPLSVKTADPIPKAKIADCMREIRKLSLKAPIAAGDVVIKDVAGTGVDVIATKSIA